MSVAAMLLSWTGFYEPNLRSAVEPERIRSLEQGKEMCWQLFSSCGLRNTSV